MRRFLAAASLAAFAAPAAAHDWYDGWCCSGKDCAPAAEGAVRIGSDGYHITVRPGEHPMVPDSADPLELHAPFRSADEFGTQVMPSRDARFHICLVPHSFGGIEFRCFYVPLGS
ncbi:UNVERIFIED_CONTAM: hypothetical protein BEN50_21550 [Euhalothece sp. KZN 001]